MEKAIYEQPQAWVFEVCTGEVIMASVEKMRTIEGSWDEDDE